MYNITQAVLFIFTLIFSSYVFANECKQITTTSAVNTANQISYQFDKAYPCGKFANGDWWVSPRSKGESVVIVEMTPLSFYGSNGFMVNPTAPNAQTYDSRGKLFQPKLIKELPLKIDFPASVIKVISKDATSEKKCRPCLTYASVLTILPSPLDRSEQYFRPGYYGNTKELFKTDQAKWRSLLKTNQIPFQSKHTPEISKISNRFANVQLEALEDYGADALHPSDNLPNYGADIARDNAEAVLRFVLNDFNLNEPDHLAAFINYLQMSVDFYSMASNGFTWRENGGHNNGRKLPLVIGAAFIDEIKFKQALKNSVFSEDQQIYLSKKNNQVLYGVECTEEVYWRNVITRKGDKTCKDPYDQIDGGGADVGKAYQWCCTIKPWTYTALALRLLHLEPLWNNDLLFSYVKRWQQHGAITKPDDCAGYNNKLEDLGKTYGADGKGGCIKGSGRWVESDGLSKGTGGHFSKFGDDMFNSFFGKVFL